MDLKWLNTPALESDGVSWGVPWKKGELLKIEDIQLQNEQQSNLPLQSWPTAYWPDGSIKWSGHAAIYDGQSKKFILSKGDRQNQAQDGIDIKESDQSITINNGVIQFMINKQGENIIEKISKGKKVIAKDGKLVGNLESRIEKDGEKQRTITRLESKVDQVIIEQSGPIRVVVKIVGNHQTTTKKQEIFPFTVRLYIYQQSTEVKMVHTFFYDGDPSKQFVKGIGFQFSTHLTSKPWNRHFRFAGEKGMYSEPATLIKTWRHRDAYGLYEKQLNGEAVDIENINERDFNKVAASNALFNQFVLYQDSAHTYQYKKRTKDSFSYLTGIHGTRAKGLAYVGDEHGGIALGIKNFWEKYPTAFEVTGLAEDETNIYAWFWAPESEAMDLRHYTDTTHVAAYEGFDEMRATPFGIANTSEAFIQIYLDNPTNEQLYERASTWEATRLLVCEPQYYYDTKATGTWSLPESDHPLKNKIEENLDRIIDFYKNEINQRNWYGYWNYGDFMHTYDTIRHQWLYDLGGYAWQNTELIPNLWLWYSFLRTGRDDIFTLAEAMTRHTSEVDTYHFGEYEGLGSRHNVSHWGCGCKEVRVSMAGLHKYYYFLTTDERMRDRLESVKDAEKALGKLDPLRTIYPNSEFETHARLGPDWSALCSNWLNEWERTGNEAYKHKILKGMETIKKLPLKLLSGPAFGYNPEKNELYHFADGTGSFHMVIAFGALQTWIEMGELFEDEEWKELVKQIGAFYLLDDETIREKTNGKVKQNNFHWPIIGSGVVSFAAEKDEELARKNWKILLSNVQDGFPYPFHAKKIAAWTDLQEVANISTNSASQWSLNAITALEFIGEYLTEDLFQ